jgi:SAM-dependent methyltransferase
VHAQNDARIVRSIAERLPFRDGAFDRVMCQGSLDHFADPAAFMREAARVLAPDGRVVIALANFESVACRVGRAVDRVKRRLGRPRPAWRLYWQIPHDHTVKGDLPYVRALGGDALVLERTWGISLLWSVRPYGWALDRLPESLARSIWRGFDRLARSRPAHADMIISVWRKRA